MTIHRHENMIDRASCAAFVVDIQEAFRPHIADFDNLVRSTTLLLSALRMLDVPVAYSEQYPKGLGSTIPEIGEILKGAPCFEKLEISSRAAAGWEELPESITGARQIIIAGIEAHVCVSQTVHDLVAAGVQVHVPADAVASRDAWQKRIALKRLEAVGAVVTTVEMILFEILETAGTGDFKAVQKLIKQHDAGLQIETASKAEEVMRG